MPSYAKTGYWTQHNPYMKQKYISMLETWVGSYQIPLPGMPYRVGFHFTPTSKLGSEPFNQFRFSFYTHSSHVVKMTAGKESRQSSKPLYLYIKPMLKHLCSYKMWTRLERENVHKVVMRDAHMSTLTNNHHKHFTRPKHPPRPSTHFLQVRQSRKAGSA
jgi:hypothetical protein